MNASAIWRTTLERLETAPIDEVSKAWLQSAHLTDTPGIGADDIDAASLAPQDQSLYFTLEVASSLARDVISTRWRRSIEDILMDLTGQPVAISVTNYPDDGLSEQDIHPGTSLPTNNAATNYAYYTHVDIPTKSALHNQLRFVGPASSDVLDEWENEQRANILMHNRLNPRYTFEAFRYRTTEEFRAKYRSVDILLVDDIQFIAGKESTEEEFFHTFNSLHEMSKQIVICSDRPPKAIVSLEERLRSRFEWGLIADIQPPDLETRMAILRVKADLLRYRVPDDIIAYIAGRVQTNIRELEGCLNRLMAYQQLHRTELTMDVARAAMTSLGNDTRETRLNSKQIVQAVAEYYQISLDAMCGKQRDKHIVMPRQIAMYLLRQETEASLLEIGQLFGGRDHSTVLHACEKIDREVNINPSLRREIVAIREQLLRE